MTVLSGIAGLTLGDIDVMATAGGVDPWTLLLALAGSLKQRD